MILDLFNGLAIKDLDLWNDYDANDLWPLIDNTNKCCECTNIYTNTKPLNARNNYEFSHFQNKMQVGWTKVLNVQPTDFMKLYWIIMDILRGQNAKWRMVNKNSYFVLATSPFQVSFHGHRKLYQQPQSLEQSFS